MIPIRFATLAAGLSALLLTLSLVGCGGKATDEDDDGRASGNRSKGGKPVAATPVAAGKGTLKGKVTLGLTPPNMAELNAKYEAEMGKHQDRAVCLADSASAKEKGDPAWELGADNGVGNVFVFLRPKSGTYFALDDSHHIRNSRGLVIELILIQFERFLLCVQDRYGTL